MRLTRRQLFGSVAGGALLAGVPSGARAFLFNGSGGLTAPPPSGLTATHTVLNISASTASGQVYVFGQPFRRGDVPAGSYAVPCDSGGTQLPSTSWQMDEACYWDDGSLRHAVYSIFMPTVLGSSTYQLQFVLITGTYSASGLRSLTDISGSHAFQMVLTDVRDHTNALVGSGAFTFDVNAAIADGIVQKVATGPVRDSWVIHGAALDVNPTATTLSGSITSGATSLTVASAAGFPTSGNYLAKIDGEYLLVTAGQGTSTWTVTRGAARSSAASHGSGAAVTFVGHFWLRHYFDVYTSPSNSAAVYGIGHMPLVMQPWLNVTGADQVTYRAALVDGVSTVRDWATAVTVPQSTNVSVAGNTVDMDAPLWERSECVDVASDGTLPGALAASTPYYMYNATGPSGQEAGGTTYKFYSGPAGPGALGTGLVTITSTGSGNLTVTRRINHSYRLGWFSTADDAGNENWTAGQPTLQPQLAKAEKDYWVASGMIVPYDTTLTPQAITISGQSDTGKYRPGCAVCMTNVIGTAGDPPQVGPLPLWVSQTFLLQDATSYGIARAAGLAKAHIPWVCALQEATGYVQPFNNGPARDGTPYSNGLGAPQPTWALDASNTLGITLPSGGISPASGGAGVFSTANGAGPGPSLGHWSLDPYFPYLVFGKRWFLDLMYFDGNLPVMVTPNIGFTSGKIAQFNGTGTTYYAKMIFGTDGRRPTSMKNTLMGALFGSSDNAERSYLWDVMSENLDFWAALQALQSAGQDTIGAFDVATNGAEGLPTWWGSWAHIWGTVLTRDSRYGNIIQRIVNQFAGRWDGSWLSPYYGPAEYFNNFTYPQNALIPSSNTGSWVTDFTDSWAHVGFSTSGGGGGSFSVVSGSTIVTLSKVLAGMLLSEGDLFKCTAPAYATSSPGNAYSGPPELNPLTVQEWFYVRAPSAPDGTNVTLGLSATPTGALISFASSAANMQFTLRPAATPPASSGVVNNANWGIVPIGYGPLHLGTMNWLKSVGAAGLDTAIANCAARVAVPKTGANSYAQVPKYDIVDVTIP